MTVVKVLEKNTHIGVFLATNGSLIASGVFSDSLCVCVGVSGCLVQTTRMSGSSAQFPVGFVCSG